MIAMGGAIGTGLFLGAGSRLHSAGPSLAIVYAVAGGFAFLVVRAMGEMAMHRPTTGSFVSYSREFIGERSAFVAGWMHFLNWATAGVADITAAALYVRYFFPAVPQWIPAAVALAVVVAINLVSVKVFGELEFWFAAIKVAAILLFMVIGIVVLVSRHQIDGHSTGPQLIADHGGFFPAGFLAAVMILQGVVFAYAGVEMVGVTAGEAQDARKVIPQAVNSIGWRIAIFYIGSVLLLVMLLPWSDYSAQQSPFVTFLDKLGVPGAGGVMDLVVLTAALSSINSGLYSTGRILRSLSVNGSAPRFAGVIGRNGVPYGGVLLTGAVYLVGLVLNVFFAGQAFEIGLNFAALGIIGMWVMIMLSHAAMLRKAKRGQLVRPDYRLPGAPFTNYLTIAFLALVFGLSWYDVPSGRVLIYATPAIAVLLVIGWFVVRGRVRRLASPHR
ncbi:MAG TPA: amino acid permease [Pseudonocardiaceae bacterium]|nr:amino acid permease [Pseudonocardiaceae bacterium]